MGVTETTAGHTAAGTAAPLPHPDESVGPLERGFAVLRALACAPGGRLRASELTRGTGLARSTVDRVAATLVELGALRAEGDGRDLVLAPAAARLGNAYLRGSGLPEALGPLARELAARLDESVSLAVADRDAVRFILQIKRRRALSVAFRAGDALPAERCAPGALFAADWDGARFEAWHARLAARPDGADFPALPRSGRPRVGMGAERVGAGAQWVGAEPERVGTEAERAGADLDRVEAEFRRRIAQASRDGWAEDDQLIEQGLIAVAVPVHDAGGEQVCALSVVSHTSRHTMASLAETVLPAMQACARQMTASLAAQARREERGEAAGMSGATGAVASTGATGETDTTNTSGAAGASTSVVGATGTAGASTSVVGATGTAGASTSAGSAGTAGAAGSTGVTGARGSSPETQASKAVGSVGAPSDPTAAAKEQHGPDYLQSLARGISVLSALGGGGAGGMTLSEAAAATGLPRATARRALLTSVRQGYAATDGHRFRVLPRILELGYARLSQLTLGDLAQPHLEEVVAAVHESASMAVLDGDQIRYVARAAAGRIMSVDIMIGTRFPAYATSMGRVLLADLPAPARARLLGQIELKALTDHTVTDPTALARVLDQVAQLGCALVDQELEEGLRSLAVPVRDPAGRAVAAVNVSLHAARTSADEARAVVLPVLLEAAARISADLALVSG